MKILKINFGILLIALLSMSSCINDFLDFNPQDKITSAMFPETEADVKMLLNGIYAGLRETEVYNQGMFGFGAMDEATPNAYNWGTEHVYNRLGNGTVLTSDGGIITYRWTRCYAIISRANYLLSIMDDVPIDNNVKDLFIGEIHFLRGLAYSLLVGSYGGVPIVPPSMSTDEARNVFCPPLFGQLIKNCYTIII